MELVIRSITPAVVQMNIEEVEKYMQEVKEKYVGWVVSEEEISVAKEERAKLNKLEKNIPSISIYCGLVKLIYNGFFSFILFISFY